MSSNTGAGPEQIAVLETLDKLMTATDKYVEGQTPDNDSALGAALEAHRRALSDAKERVRFAVIALAQKEFEVATPEGKLTIAKELQEDMGNMGIKGALSCAFAGVTGTATVLHKKLMESGLFDGDNKVKEEAIPKKKTEVVPGGKEPNEVVGKSSREASKDGGAADEEEEQGVKETNAKGGMQEQLGRLIAKLNPSQVKELEGPKERSRPVSESTEGEQAESEEGPKPSEADSTADGDKKKEDVKHGSIMDGVNEQLERLAGKINAARGTK